MRLHRQWTSRHHRARRHLSALGGHHVRGTLRRRLFAWFLGGVLTTGVLVAVAMAALGRTEGAHAGLAERIQVWVGRAFERDWDDAVTRARFARRTAEDLGGGLELYDAAGTLLLREGIRCGTARLDFPVMRGEERLGAGHLCFPHEAPGWRAGLLLALGLLGLWLASGRVARRLSRPLDELTEAVRHIGGGDLAARAKVSCDQPEEIGVVAEAVNEMASRIEKQLRDQRELLAAVSHELRTPLARLRLVSEIARDSGATPKTFDDLDREVMELDALVGQLLANSRLEFGQPSLRSLSLSDLTAEAVRRAGLAPDIVRIEAQDDGLEADPTLLHRALANLFDNARTHAGGVEAVHVTHTGERVRFAVLDRGPGLDEDVEALFRPFSRGRRGADSGLGLGLALVQRIAQAHRGVAFARARDGGGAEFGLELPAHGRGGSGLS